MASASRSATASIVAWSASVNAFSSWDVSQVAPRTWPPCRMVQTSFERVSPSLGLGGVSVLPMRWPVTSTRPSAPAM